MINYELVNPQLRLATENNDIEAIANFFSILESLRLEFNDRSKDEDAQTLLLALLCDYTFKQNPQLQSNINFAIEYLINQTNTKLNKPKGPNGYTPLMRVCMDGNLDAIEIFFRKENLVRFDINQRCRSENKTALAYFVSFLISSHSENHSFLPLFKNANADFNVLDQGSNSLLDLVLRYSKRETLPQTLMQLGALKGEEIQRIPPKVFSLLTLLNQGYCQIITKPQANQANAIKFFTLVNQLPPEIQMKISNLLIGSRNSFVSSKKLEAELPEIFQQLKLN